MREDIEDHLGESDPSWHDIIDQINQLVLTHRVIGPATLISLLPSLHEDQIETLSSYEKEIKALALQIRLLLAKALRTSGTNRIGLLRQALSSLGLIEDWKRKVSLWAQLLEPLAEQIFLIIETQISIPDRLPILLSIAPRLTRDMKKKALGWFLDYPDEALLASLLTGLARYLTGDLLPEALYAAYQLSRNKLRAEALTSLLPFLSGPMQAEVKRTALLAAKSTENEEERAIIVSDMAAHLRSHEVAQAFVSALAIKKESLRALVIAKLAPYLSPRLIEKALAANRGFRGSDPRYFLILSLLPFAEQSPLMSQEVGVMSGSLVSFREVLPAIASKIKNQRYRVEAIINLASRVDDSWKAGLLEAILGIEGEEGQATGIVALSPYLPHKQLVTALASAANLSDPLQATSSILFITSYLPATLKTQAFRQAASIIDKSLIGSPTPRASRSLRGPLSQPVSRALLLKLENELQIQAGDHIAFLLERLPDSMRNAQVEGILNRIVKIKRIPQIRKKATKAVTQLIRGKPALPQTDRKPKSRKLKSRRINTGFAAMDQAQFPVDRGMPLEVGKRYWFWLQIGAPLRGAIASATPVELPESIQFGRLIVVLFAFPNEIDLSPEADIGELEILNDGSIKVRKQGQSPSITDRDLLSKRLFFPVSIPAKSQSGATLRLRCNLYYKQVLIQSLVVSAKVTNNPTPAVQPFSVVVDYTLASGLDPAHLAEIAPHILSLMVNSNQDGTHGFRFLGAGGEIKGDAAFDNDEIQDHVTTLRKALRVAAWGNELPYDPQIALPSRYDGQLDLQKLKDDLFSFARKGYRFYDQIIDRLAGSSTKAADLAVAMLEPGRVQVAAKRSARMVLPIALLYDYKLDPNLDLSLCPSFVRSLGNDHPLEDSECFNGACPIRNKYDFVCPSGFWGFRHYLGLPVTVNTAPDAPQVLTFQPPIQMTIGVSTDPYLVERPDHERILKTLTVEGGWNYGDTRSEVIRILKQTKPHLVYFYCHGGTKGRLPYIEVGPKGELGITPDFIRTYDIRWSDSRPLVFINGCHTTALEPENALEFVSRFIETAQAAGVIGTEISVFEPLARSFAETCLRSFLLEGVEIGRAVRNARLALLKKGNPLGLIYIPFIIASFRLKAIS